MSRTASKVSVANLLAPSPSAGPSSPLLADMGENELIAAAALKGMQSSHRVEHDSGLESRSSQPTPALSVTTSYTTLSDATFERDIADGEDDASADFVSRVARVPLVSSVRRAYENSKNSSRVVKYGAEMVESSVLSISKPVFDRLPVGQLDEFACRQLDRWGSYTGKPSSDASTTAPMQLDERSLSRDRGRTAERGHKRLRAPSAMSQSPDPGPSESKTPNDEQAQAHAIAVRSTWQTVVTEASGISAAVSEESMKRLKYCLHWLQYATTRIDDQIEILRGLIASVDAQQQQQQASSLNSSRTQAPADVVVSPHALQTLNDVKRDVVQTIRDVVNVVSQYAGGALPEPAKATVRAFILHLPQRWASRMQAPGPDGAPDIADIQPGQPPTAGVASAAAHRIMGLATESLDMMRSVTGVFKDSLDRAETWVERFRLAGYPRQVVAPTEGDESSPYGRYSLPRLNSGAASDAGFDDDGFSVGAGTGPHSPAAPLSPVGSTGSIGASLDALTLAASLQQQQQQQQQNQRYVHLPSGGRPRFTVGGGMEVDDDA